MRSYIFTPRERETLQAFLRGEIDSKDLLLRQIASRHRNFKDLATDVDLYIQLRGRLAKT